MYHTIYTMCVVCKTVCYTIFMTCTKTQNMRYKCRVQKYRQRVYCSCVIVCPDTFVILYLKQPNQRTQTHVAFILIMSQLSLLKVTTIPSNQNHLKYFIHFPFKAKGKNTITTRSQNCLSCSSRLRDLVNFPLVTESHGVETLPWMMVLMLVQI